MFIKDEPAAYFLDCAVFLFGASYEADLDAAAEGGKSKQARSMAMAQVQKRWLNDGAADPQEEAGEFEVVPTEEKYLDPASKFNR